VPTVWVVDDDETITSVVASYLERAGHVPRLFADGTSALTAFGAAAPDLLVLDLMLPGTGGRVVCRSVRTTYPTLPIIVLTALGEFEDRIAGLEAGADDYVAKPFSPRELVLRVDSVLRRSGRADSRPVLTAGRVVLDQAARRASRDGADLDLTVREFDLLAFLMAHPGVVYRRRDLMRQVWGWTFGDESTVTVHVRRLREKVEDDPRAPELIHTVWGVGYRLDAP
jgi:two-component system, OmpR family, response regulator ResD